MELINFLPKLSQYETHLSVTLDCFQIRDDQRVIILTEGLFLFKGIRGKSMSFVSPRKRGAQKCGDFFN